MGISKADSRRIREMLSKAEEDLADSKLLFENKRLKNSCYLAQQCGEKATKAFLLAQGSFSKTHTPSAIFELQIRKLSEEKFIKPLEKARKFMKDLEEYWIKPRYPSDFELIQYSKEKAEKAIEKAEFILEIIRKFLNKKYKVSLD